MKKFFFITDTMANKISYWHLIAFVIALPYDYFFSQLVLGSLVVHTVIHLKREDLKNIFSKRVLLISAIFLLGLVSGIYSIDKKEALGIAVKQLAIIIVPVLFALNPLNVAKYRITLLKTFAFTCTIAISYLFAIAFFNIYTGGGDVSSLFSLAFMNHNFSFPIEMHATYLSVYVAFSICIFLYLIQTDTDSRLKYIYIFALLLLIAGMFQLSSRAVFIALLIITNLIMPFILAKGKKRGRLLAAMSIVSLVVIFIITNVNSFKVRYLTELKRDLNDNTPLIENEEPRIVRWEAIIELVKKSPLVGFGAGAENTLLQEKYYEKKLFISYLNQLNTHSEYLSILIKMGAIGLLLYLFVLFKGVMEAWKNMDFLFLSFITLIIIVSLSENVLDRNKGIFFFAFFFSLFYVKTVKGEFVEN